MTLSVCKRDTPQKADWYNWILVLFPVLSDAVSPVMLPAVQTASRVLFYESHHYNGTFTHRYSCHDALSSKKILIH